MGREVGDVSPIEQHPSLVGGLEARDQLEHRGLPRAVRPNEADYLSFAHSERDPIHRTVSGERLGKALDFEPRRGGGPGGGARRPSPLRRAGRGPAQEHRPEDVVALQQIARGSPEADFALLHEERGFRDRQRHVHGLLDHHDCYSVVVQVTHHFEELLHNHGGEAQRQLVDEEDPGLGHERHRHAEHVLLAAGQVRGGLVQLLPKAREHLEHSGGLPLHVQFVPAVQPSAQGDVLSDGEGTEHALAAGHLGDPERGDPVRRHRGDVGPLERHRPAACCRNPGDGPQHGGLSRAVGSQQRHEVAFSDFDVDAEQHLHRPVGHVDRPHAQQRAVVIVADEDVGEREVVGGRRLLARQIAENALGVASGRSWLGYRLRMPEPGDLAVVVDALVGKKIGDRDLAAEGHDGQQTPTDLVQQPAQSLAQEHQHQKQADTTAGEQPQRPDIGRDVVAEELGALEEHRAEDRARHRPETADDHHREDSNALRRRERALAERLLVQREQTPGQRGVETRDGKRHQLGPGQIHAERLGVVLVVAGRPQHPRCAGCLQAPHGPDHGKERGEAHVVEGVFARHVDPPQKGQPGHPLADVVGKECEPVLVEEKRRGRDREGECGHREEEPADAQGRQPDDHRRDRPDDPGQQQSEG